MKLLSVLSAIPSDELQKNIYFFSSGVKLWNSNHKFIIGRMTTLLSRSSLESTWLPSEYMYNKYMVYALTIWFMNLVHVSGVYIWCIYLVHVMVHVSGACIWCMYLVQVSGACLAYVLNVNCLIFLFVFVLFLHVCNV